MKKIFFIISALFLCHDVFAQKDELTLDEHNKLIYYQVADMPGVKADTLYNRTLVGLHKDFKAKGEKPVAVAGQSISLKSVLVLYNTGGIARHESGEVAYQLNVEFKDGKYRYWLSDMVFTPYERNRYNVYARVAGMDVPFESVKTKYDDKTFEAYSIQIVKFGKQIGDQLKVYIAPQLKKATSLDKIDTRKW